MHEQRVGRDRVGACGRSSIPLDVYGAALSGGWVWQRDRWVVPFEEEGLRDEWDNVGARRTGGGVGGGNEERSEGEDGERSHCDT